MFVLMDEAQILVSSLLLINKVNAESVLLMVEMQMLTVFVLIDDV